MGLMVEGRESGRGMVPFACGNAVVVEQFREDCLPVACFLQAIPLQKSRHWHTRRNRVIILLTFAQKNVVIDICLSSDYGNSHYSDGDSR